MAAMMRSLIPVWRRRGRDAGEFGKEALDKVEPGAVFGREREFEAPGWLSGEPSFGFS